MSDPGSEAGLDVLPGGLPAYELSTPTGYEEDRVGRVYWQRATYETYRGAQIVRRHYHDLLRERGWRIISNDPVRNGAALITASRGTSEVTIRITPRSEGVDISVSVTEIQSASRTPEPQPSADASTRAARSAPGATRLISRTAPSAVEPDGSDTRPRTGRPGSPPRQVPHRPEPSATPEPSPSDASKHLKKLAKHPHPKHDADKGQEHDENHERDKHDRHKPKKNEHANHGVKHDRDKHERKLSRSGRGRDDRAR